MFLVFFLHCGQNLVFQFFLPKLREKIQAWKGFQKYFRVVRSTWLFFIFLWKKRARLAAPASFSKGKYKKNYRFSKKNGKRTFFGKKYSFKSSIAKLKGGFGKQPLFNFSFEQGSSLWFCEREQSIPGKTWAVAHAGSVFEKYFFEFFVFCSSNLDIWFFIDNNFHFYFFFGIVCRISVLKIFTFKREKVKFERCQKKVCGVLAETSLFFIFVLNFVRDAAPRHFTSGKENKILPLKSSISKLWEFFFETPIWTFSFEHESSPWFFLFILTFLSSFGWLLILVLKMFTGWVVSL